ncbi:site-specific DNA-methyltransferase [Peribacillus cavernae]|uniref:Site-specific DNA-methyltransferase n=1 Tax=Peribacillus cavernae TaxID=1674310 RepID=A0A3S0TVR8_9BACI|nr:DNA methyltransferase [Peribacillus cavernae]MDQ0221424.1 adenine-specific DNA-methyltransferase [Peribacillus cavernae]RUQ24160.1 site-specific DNA-methyltransferase [Peribacillus cavernae]
MSQLTSLIAQAKVKDPELGKELEREFKVLASRKPFGLNFERHRPESTELPGRPVRKGEKVRVLPLRGKTSKADPQLWRVRGFENVDGKRMAQLETIGTAELETQQVVVEDLVVVEDFGDYIYPGLVSTGQVVRGGDKPYHTVINSENFHALEALTFTHRGKIDLIYIDPPYNTGARDWKYNNNYVEGDDVYRHSKWLAFIERRLRVAKGLLNPECSMLIVTIDEKELHRLGLLLEQVFPGQRIQMISNMINPKGAARGKEFYRVDEYIFYVYFGAAEISDERIPGLCVSKSELTDEDSNNNSIEVEEKKLPPVRWASLLRSGSGAQREESKLKFYPIYIDINTKKIIGCGEPLPLGEHPDLTKKNGDIIEVWPIRQNGSEGRWQLNVDSFRSLLKDNYIKIGSINKNNKVTLYYLMEGQREKIASGELVVTGTDAFGGLVVEYSGHEAIEGRPRTQWATTAHSATDHGTSLLRKIIPGRKFPFPKSLYAVEDTLRFFISNKPDAIVLDFFAGSGTTCHAVARLNRQDGGRRQCILVTNNEVAANEQAALRKAGLRPGDPEWEKWGICEYITKPRIEASITGRTPEGEEIKGDYSFYDKFPLAEGFAENAEFFTLTYETPVAVSHDRAFERIAPLLWMRAGSKGRRIESLPEQGWDVTDTYGLLKDLDKVAAFAYAVEERGTISIVYIVTDDERRFQSVAQRLPSAIEPIRLYESYLTNFRFSVGL